jgi:hypothetical protein
MEFCECGTITRRERRVVWHPHDRSTLLHCTTPHAHPRNLPPPGSAPWAGSRHGDAAYTHAHALRQAGATLAAHISETRIAALHVQVTAPPPTAHTHSALRLPGCRHALPTRERLCTHTHNNTATHDQSAPRAASCVAAAHATHTTDAHAQPNMRTHTARLAGCAR